MQISKWRLYYINPRGYESNLENQSITNSSTRLPSPCKVWGLLGNCKNWKDGEDLCILPHYSPLSSVVKSSYIDSEVLCFSGGELL
jgi:hypothetical protein